MDVAGTVDGGAEITVICHGHVDVIDIDPWMRRALVGQGCEFVRAFVGGIGKPVDGGAVDAVPRTT